MPVNINGTTGIDTPGLASTVMPTSGGDAIVESGSNTDGEWTRWADGTASWSREKSVSVNIVAGGYHQLYTNNPPTALVGNSFGASIDYVKFTNSDESRDIYASVQGGYLSNMWTVINTGRAAQATGPSFTTLGNDTAAITKYKISGSGRWK